VSVKFHTRRPGVLSDLRRHWEQCGASGAQNPWCPVSCVASTRYFWVVTREGLSAAIAYCYSFLQCPISLNNNQSFSAVERTGKHLRYERIVASGYWRNGMSQRLFWTLHTTLYLYNLLKFGAFKTPRGRGVPSMYLYARKSLPVAYAASWQQYRTMEEHDNLREREGQRFARSWRVFNATPTNSSRCCIPGNFNIPIFGYKKKFPFPPFYFWGMLANWSLPRTNSPELRNISILKCVLYRAH